MTLHQLKVFKTLVESQNFKLAARELFLSEPSLRLQIASLEKSLDTELINRKESLIYKKLIFTPAGAKIYGHACEIIRRANEIMEISRKDPGKVRPPLNVLVNEPVSAHIIPSVLRQMKITGEKVAFHLTVRTDYNELEKLAMHGENYDIGILPLLGDKYPGNMVYRFPMRTLLITSNCTHKDRVFNLEDTANTGLTLLLPTNNSIMRIKLESFCSTNRIILQNYMEIGSPNTVRKMTRESPDYLAFLSSHAVIEELRREELFCIPTKPTLPSIDYAVIMPPSTGNDEQRNKFFRYFVREAEIATEIVNSFCKIAEDTQLPHE